jgi:tetratricopeptide (TPR) repeat protein
MIPPPDRPRFYNLRAKMRRAAAVVFNESMLGAKSARRSWLWLVRGPGRIFGHEILRRFAFGLPAVAVAAAAVTILAVNPKANQITLRTRYRAEANQALAAGRWDDARIRFQRLAADAGYPPDDVYGLARALEGEGRRDDAEILFLRLAPEDTTGQPAAHVRRAMRLLAQKPPATLRAQGQLLRALDARPDYAEAHALLGQLLQSAGDTNGAARHFLLGVRSHPELSLPLAIVFVGRDPDASLRWAAVAVEHYGAAAKAHPDNADAQHRYALALRLAHRYRDAADVIRAGLAQSDDFRLRLLAGEVYAEWCESLAGEGRAAERLRRIEEGLEVNPAAGPLLQGLVTLAAGAGPTASDARASAERLMARGGTVAVGLRMAFGVDAQRRGDLAEARRFVGEAHRDDPASPAAANTLAWLLIQDPDADPERALAIINAALKGRADQPSLRDTRGQVLVRLGQWQEATRDLEYALPLITPNRHSHRALARAYRGLNLITLAEAQDRRADEVTKR